MKLVQFNCPACRATIEVDETRDYVFCQYCGTKVYLDKEVHRSEVVHIYRDEAKLREIEIREQEKKKIEEAAEAEKKREEQLKAKKEKTFHTYTVIGLFVAALTAFIWYDYRFYILIPTSLFIGFLSPIDMKEKGASGAIWMMGGVLFAIYYGFLHLIRWICHL